MSDKTNTSVDEKHAVEGSPHETVEVPLPIDPSLYVGSTTKDLLKGGDPSDHDLIVWVFHFIEEKESYRRLDRQAYENRELGILKPTSDPAYGRFLDFMIHPRSDDVLHCRKTPEGIVSSGCITIDKKRIIEAMKKYYRGELYSSEVGQLQLFGWVYKILQQIQDQLTSQKISKYVSYFGSKTEVKDDFVNFTFIFHFELLVYPPPTHKS